MKIAVAIIVLLTLTGMARVTTGSQQAQRPKPSALQAVTLTKDTLSLWSARHAKTVVVFVNTYCCTSCNGPVGELLSELNLDTSSCEIILLLRGGASSLHRREVSTLAAPYYPSARRILFDIQTAPDPPVSQRVKEGAFGAFGIVRTPSLLVWDNRQARTLLKVEYEKLFESRTMRIAGGTKKKIMQALSLTK